MEFQQIDQEVSKLLQELKETKSEEKILKLVGSLSARLIENNYPYMPRIVSQIREINKKMNGNGVVHVQIKLYNGDVQEAVFHEITKVKF